MTEGIESYLSSLKLSTVARRRIDEVSRAFQLLNQDKPVAKLFVSDRIDPETGKTVHADVWGFTDVFLLASRDFMTRGNADISPYKRSISYLGLEYSGLEFGGEPNEDWRLSVELETGGGHTYSQISAVGVNARYLLEIVNELFVPSLREDMLHTIPSEPKV
jgi:hypothetical protein